MKGTEVIAARLEHRPKGMVLGLNLGREQG
jgi:hypothetical protein